MPKLSVYVADELWEQARQMAGATGAKVNNSHVVQQALEQLVSERTARRAAFAAGARRDPARIAAVVEQLRADATRAWERGYEAGLALAEVLGFDELRQAMNAGGLGDPGGVAWLQEIAYSVPGLQEWWQQACGAFMKLGHPDDAIIMRDEPFQAGSAQALEDVWRALKADAWGTTPAPVADCENDESGEGKAE